MADDRTELERLRKLKRLRELEAKASGAAPTPPQEPADPAKTYGRLDSAIISAADVFPGVRDLTAQLNKDKFGGDAKAAKAAVDAQFQKAIDDNPLSSAAGAVAASVPGLASKTVLGLAARGGALGAAQGAGRGVEADERLENAAGQGALGAAAGALSPAIVQGVAKAGNAARKFIPGLSKDAGIRTLSRSPAQLKELQEAAAKFRADTGRGATLAEIAPPRLREQIRTATQSTLKLTDAAQRSLKDFERKFQERGAQVVRDGKPRPINVPAAEKKLTEQTTAAFKKIERLPVVFDPQEAKFLNSRDARKLLMRAANATDSPARKQSLVDLATSAGTRSPTAPIMLRDVENLRLGIEKLSKDDPGVAFELGQIGDRIVAATRTKIPEYGAVLDNFAEQKKLFEATKLGQKAAKADPTALREEAAAAVDPGQAPAFRAAARESVAREFEGGSGQAFRTARQLTEDVEGGKRATLALGADAPRVTRSLKAEADGFQNVASAIAKRSKEQVPDDTASNVALASAGFTGGARGFWLTAASLFRKVGMSKAEAEQIVEISLQPGGAETAIERLTQNGLDRKRATLLVSSIPTAAASTSGREQ